MLLRLRYPKNDNKVTNPGAKPKKFIYIIHPPIKHASKETITTIVRDAKIFKYDS